MPPRKPTPREIRRAFGADALSVINDHADNLEALNKQIGFLTDRDTSHNDRLQLVEQSSFDLANALSGVRRREDDRAAMGLLDRLRWLFLGR